MSKGCSAVKRFGESCPKNNNCTYPKCLETMSEAMKNVPKTIYLQVDADGETPEDFKGLEVTWCVDRIHENDIEYTLTEHAQQETESLQKRVEELDALFNAAKNYIDNSPCDPDIYPEQLEAWRKYQQLLKQGD